MMDVPVIPAFTKPSWQPNNPRSHAIDVRVAEVLCVAASVLAMTFMGTFFVAFFYLLWLPRVFMAKAKFPPAKALFFPVLLVGYALLSTFWSDHPDVTERNGIEFASMMVCTAIMAGTVSINAFILGVVVGACATVIGVVVQTGGLPQGAGGESADLVGSMGSKNQVGAIAEVGIYCALLSWFICRTFPLRMAFSLFPLAVCAIGLIYSRSATSDVSLLAMLAASCGMFLIAKLPLKARVPVLFFAVFLIGVAAAVGVAFDWKTAGLDAVGKDATLTGRTFLWDEGIKTGMNNPILGVGYNAFWVQGTSEAEMLWYKFHIPNRSGFHFHNLLINEFVDLGLLGAGLWVLVYVVTLASATRYLRRNGNGVESIFYVGMMWMYIVRAFTEVDTKGPYSFAVLFFFFVVMRVASRKSPMIGITPPLGSKPLVGTHHAR